MVVVFRFLALIALTLSVTTCSPNSIYGTILVRPSEKTHEQHRARVLDQLVRAEARRIAEKYSLHQIPVPYTRRESSGAIFAYFARFLATDRKTNSPLEMVLYLTGEEQIEGGIKIKVGGSSSAARHKLTASLFDEIRVALCRVPDRCEVKLYD